MGGEYQRHHQAASQSAENSRRKANRGERGGCVIRSVIEEWSRKVADAAERITRSPIVVVVVLALLL